MCRRYTLYLTNALGALAAALLLTACDPFAAPESLFDEYVERAARVLDGKARLSPVPVVEPLPRRRERVVDIPPVNLSLLDFLSLYGCELQHVVGERNSIMGRVMHPASVYDYELRFLRAAEACLGMIDNDELAARLREAVGTKRGQLVDAAWNAVWATTEIEDFLTRSRGPLAVAPDRDMAATLAADLQALTAALAVPDGEPPELDFRGFDDVYQRWQSRPMAGQALRAAAPASARLDDASALIEARLEGRPVCPRPDVQPRAAEPAAQRRRARRARSGIAPIFSGVSSSQRIPGALRRAPAPARHVITRSGVATRSSRKSCAVTGISPVGRT